jgi:hypothetical protein
MLLTSEKRVAPNAGIAIGPILFIIAILAILAAAIAAGSGTFMVSTTAESNKTRSSALIQIGENLKIGMDQITMEVGIAPNNVNLEYTETSNSNGLFSPVGGGIARPSPGMAANPLKDGWYFVKGDVTGFGTGNDVVMAVLPVAEGVCAEVNNRVLGTAGYPSGAFNDFTTNVVDGTWPVAGNWTSVTTGGNISGPSLTGIATGCVENTDITVDADAGPTTQFFFYQVLAIQ